MQKPEKREPDKGKPEAKDKTKKKKQQPYTAENGWPFESSKDLIKGCSMPKALHLHSRSPAIELLLAVLR